MGRYIGSDEYWENIFSSETNRDKTLHNDFSKLHNKIVNMVIRFCEKHGLENVDEVHIHADGLMGSYGHSKWTPATDSDMSLIKSVKDKSGIRWADREHPFLYEI